MCLEDTLGAMDDRGGWREKIRENWHDMMMMMMITFNSVHCPVSWGCRIQVRPSPSNECPEYDTKQSDDDIPVMLELWKMWSTPLLSSLPGPLWPGVVAPNKGPYLWVQKN